MPQGSLQSAGKTASSPSEDRLAQIVPPISAKQRFLRGESGAVLAEWVVITAVVVTLCMVTTLCGDADLADNRAVEVISGV